MGVQRTAWDPFFRQALELCSLTQRWRVLGLMPKSQETPVTGCLSSITKRTASIVPQKADPLWAENALSCLLFLCLSSICPLLIILWS